MNAYLIPILIVLGILLLIFFYASFVRSYANSITTWFAIKKLDINKPLEDYARLLLDEHGLQDVQVKKVGFFASMFIGNTYKVSSKTIRISWFAARHSSVTTLAQVCRMVGLAKMHNEGVKGLKTVEFNRYFGWLPVLLLPLIIIGLILDLIFMESIGLYSIIFTCIGLAITIFSFIISMIALKRELRAYTIGEEIITAMGILNDEETKKIGKLYSAWKRLVVINAIFNAFEVIYFILKLILQILSSAIKRG